MREDWSTLRKLMFQHIAVGGSLKEYEVTGNPAKFNTNIAKALSGFTIPFLPIQTGTNPSPENICPISGWTGVKEFHLTGVNHWDEQWEVGQYNSAGTAVDGNNQIRSKNLIPVEPETEYYFYFGVNMNCRLYFLAENGSVISYQGQPKGTFTTPAGCKWMKFHTGSGYGTTYNHDISINYPATETGYNQFATVYPVTFPALGKNLLNPAELAKGLYSNADFDRSSTTSEIYRSIKAHLAPGTYTLSFDKAVNIVRIVKDGVYTNRGIENISSYSFTTETDSDFGVSWRDAASSSTEWDDSSPVMLNTGETALPYEPFTNTIYGGTLDAVNGVVMVEWEGFSKKWSEGASATDMGSGITRKIFPMVDYLTTGTANNMCNIAPYQASENAITHFYYSGSGSTNRNCRVFLPSDTPDTTEITVITKLSQTYEIPLSDITVPVTLAGDNTIWTDTNGENTIKYKKKG